MEIQIHYRNTKVRTKIFIKKNKHIIYIYTKVVDNYVNNNFRWKKSKVLVSEERAFREQIFLQKIYQATCDQSNWYRNFIAPWVSERLFFNDIRIVEVNYLNSFRSCQECKSKYYFHQIRWNLLKFCRQQYQPSLRFLPVEYKFSDTQKRIRAFSGKLTIFHVILQFTWNLCIRREKNRSF